LKPYIFLPVASPLWLPQLAQLDRPAGALKFSVPTIGVASLAKKSCGDFSHLSSSSSPKCGSLSPDFLGIEKFR